MKVFCVCNYGKRTHFKLALEFKPIYSFQKMTNRYTLRNESTSRFEVICSTREGATEMTYKQLQGAVRNQVLNLMIKNCLRQL